MNTRPPLTGLHRFAGWTLIALLVTIIISGCGQTSAPPVAQVPPTPTSTPTLMPTPTLAPIPTLTPSPAPVPTPTPVPPPPPSPPPPLPSVCIPGPGVPSVSSAVIYYGDGSKRQVSLTFDSDGGSVGNANAYLDILSADGIHATWFLTGQFAQANPAVVRRIRDNGHDIGNHTMDHPNLISPPRTDGFICSELVQANNIISGVSGRTTRPFFRPPGGNFNTQVRTLAARLGYRTIYWSIDPRDWDATTTTTDIVNRVLNSPNLKPGAIILLHVNSPNERYALPQVISGLRQRGYAIVPLSQLLR